ncbi:MAG: hypothetical protein P8X93_02835 [Gammaproteobacteria bacterium]
MAEDIQARASELSFNSAFLREMRAIAFSKKMIDKDWLPSGKLDSRMKNINIHIIQDQVLSLQFNSKSRYNTLPSFIKKLHDVGYACAQVWIEEKFAKLGKKSTVDLDQLFC